jgi:glucokinase
MSVHHTETSSKRPPGLVADVGGTHIRIALACGNQLDRIRSRKCADFPSLEAALASYLDEIGPGERPVRAAVAVACPVDGDWVELTNQSWSFSTSELARALALESVDLLNDFTALALAIPNLSLEDTRLIKPGTPDPDAALAVLGPGTGLGVSGLVPTAEGWIALSTEGGHRDLAAVTEREWQVFRVLQQRFGHVSTERVLSGPGLVNLYHAICGVNGVDAAEMTPERVVEAAAASSDGPAAEAARLFSGWLGAVTGDLVLCLGARGGVYIGGGVLLKMWDVFDLERFTARLLDKGRFREYVETVPVYAVAKTEVALLGAASRVTDCGPPVTTEPAST